MNIGIASLIATSALMLVAVAWVFGTPAWPHRDPNTHADPNGFAAPQP